MRARGGGRHNYAKHVSSKLPGSILQYIVSDKMNIVKDRLIRCFAATFPALREEEIPLAAVGSLGEWNSLKSITLITVIEQEFGSQVSDEDLENFISFDQILGYLERDAGQRS